MLDMDNCKKDYRSDERGCKEIWCEEEKKPKPEEGGCNVIVNVYCDKCKERWSKDDMHECEYKKETKHEDGKCCIYVNIYCGDNKK